MKQWSNLSLSLVMGGLATSIAFAQSPVTPEVLFYDGFESGDLSNWPFSNGAGPQEPLVTGPSTGAGDSNVVFRGTKAAKLVGRNPLLPATDPVNLTRVEKGALLSRPQVQAETLLYTFYYYDVIGQEGYGTLTGVQSPTNHRYYMRLIDRSGNTSPFADGGSLVQILAMGAWNQATNNSLTPAGSINGGWFGSAPSITSYYAARLFSVTFGNGSGWASATDPSPGNTAPNWTYVGVPDIAKRRQNGWRKMTIAYSTGQTDGDAVYPGVVEYFVDSDRRFFWVHNVTGDNSGIKPIDSIALNGLEQPAVDLWLDEISARTFPRGSVQLVVSLGDVVNAAGVANVPLTVELIPSGGNTNPGIGSFTVSSDANGEVLFSTPTDVRGQYDLVVDGGSWLKRRLTVNVNDHGLFEVAVNMQNGDVDQSGEVDAADIDQVIANFGQTGVGPTQGDVDLSDEIDAADIDIVIANFGGTDQ